MRARLEAIANLSILVLAVVVGTVVVKRHFFPARPPSPPPAVQKGDQIAPPASLSFQPSERTLLLALSPRCGFCAESMPFYRLLVAYRTAARLNLRIVALVGSPEYRADQEEVLGSEAVAVDALLAADFPALRIPATPMLVLVDRRGRVLEAWRGRLAPTAQREVLATLGAPPAACGPEAASLERLGACLGETQASGATLAP